MYNKSWSVLGLENQEVTEQEAETDGREDEREQMLDRWQMQVQELLDFVTGMKEVVVVAEPGVWE